MTTNLHSILLIFSAIASTSVLASDSYLCVADMTTGFAFDKNTRQWQSAIFHSDKKFIVSNANAKPFVWIVKEVGSSIPGAGCKEDFNEIGNLWCNGAFEFRFNRNRLRFLYIHPHETDLAQYLSEKGTNNAFIYPDHKKPYSRRATGLRRTAIATAVAI